MMSLAVLLCVAVLSWSGPNLSSGQTINIDLTKGFNYTTPIYCPSAVAGLSDCKPSACYWSGSRSECCMYRATYNGILVDQCKCNYKVNCTVVLTTTTVSTTTTEPFLDGSPQFCDAYTPTTPKNCSSIDPCFKKSTRASCCYLISYAGGKFEQKCTCEDKTLMC
ncbi:uncharacterized protein LOC131944380 [Physella acuta]|uniref:uncharacterized protein LOC131944380 n=1 Tax=Physella acuta TaxID=109671 RepID=UPI0027DBB117|nr:uncharacterized protein LOC131944380 [Physella acuta]